MRGIGWENGWQWDARRQGAGGREDEEGQEVGFEAAGADSGGKLTSGRARGRVREGGDGREAVGSRRARGGTVRRRGRGRGIRKRRRRGRGGEGRQG